MIKVYFGQLVMEYIKEEGKLAKDVAEKVGRTPASQFSKWSHGRWTYIEPKKLQRIVEAVTSNRQKRVNLIVAYLVDMTPAPFRPFIDVKPRMLEENPADTNLMQKRWSLALRSKIEAIGEAYAKDTDFMRMVDNLATWAETLRKREKGG